ncbi:MAG: hypothetical protein CMD99_06550 [Gammaproteobacteria bacterium]|nr:hypothetical protein [Gammaproteobacteria bacterium]
MRGHFRYLELVVTLYIFAFGHHQSLGGAFALGLRKNIVDIPDDLKGHWETEANHSWVRIE